VTQDHKQTRPIIPDIYKHVVSVCQFAVAIVSLFLFPQIQIILVPSSSTNYSRDNPIE